MITVRFPSGFSVQYNSLCAMKWDNSSNGMVLYASVADRDAGKGWVVHVPADCIVEFISPCRTYDAKVEDNKFHAIQAEIRKLKNAVNRIARNAK